MAFDLIIWVIYLFSLYYGIFWFLVYLEHGYEEVQRKPSKFPLVTIAIPAYNEEESIAATIDSVIALDYPKEKLEILIVNDGSKDLTAKRVQSAINKHKTHKIILINQVNSGKGAAVNNALKQAKGEFFITLDADSYVKSDALNVIMPYFENKETACVLPLIKVKNPKTIIQKLQYIEYLINFFYKKLISKLDCIHVTPGPFAVYKTSVLKKVGGFDENNLTEDLEMALRLQKNNYKIEQILGTEILTDAPENFIAFYKQRNRWYKGALLNFFNYRKLMFNRSYGEFGMFYLPTALSVAVLAITYATYISYNYAFKPMWNYLYDISFVNFNFPFLISKATENFTFLNLNYMTMFYGLLIMALSVAVMLISFKATKENFKKAVIPSTMFLLLYPTILAVIWTGVLFDLIRGKKQKW